MAKLNARGSSLLYGTYLGGYYWDAGYGIATDGSGSAYATGTASSGFPTTAGALHTTGAGAFVTKISPFVGPGTPETMEAGSPSELSTTCAVTAMPVNCATGNFWHSADLTIPGRGMALHFARTYNSLLAGNDGPLGFGWTHNYNMFLTTDGTGADRLG